MWLRPPSALITTPTLLPTHSKPILARVVALFMPYRTTPTRLTRTCVIYARRQGVSLEIGFQRTQTDHLTRPIACGLVAVFILLGSGEGCQFQLSCISSWRFPFICSDLLTPPYMFNPLSQHATQISPSRL